MTIQLTITATVVSPDSEWNFTNPASMKQALEELANEKVKHWFKGRDCRTNVTATATPDEDKNPKT